MSRRSSALLYCLLINLLDPLKTSLLTDESIGTRRTGDLFELQSEWRGWTRQSNATLLDLVKAMQLPGTGFV